MYVFGIAVLLALGVMCVARWVERPLQGLRERVPVSLYPLVEVALGIGLVWAVRFNLWSLWHIPMRADWIALTLTGVVIGGIAHFFTEVLAMFAGLGRKLQDEAEVIEHPTKLGRAA